MRCPACPVRPGATCYGETGQIPVLCEWARDPKLAARVARRCEQPPPEKPAYGSPPGSPGARPKPARLPVARPQCAYREPCGCELPQCLHPLWGPEFGKAEQRQGLDGPLPALHRVDLAACVACGGGREFPAVAAVKPYESLAWLKREPDPAPFLEVPPPCSPCGPPVFGWLHIAVMGRWERIARELFSRVERSGLLGATTKIFAGVVGPEADLSWFPDWVEVARRDGDLAMGENSTLEALWSWSKTAGAGKVWYAHTKGASHENAPNVEAWRAYLFHFNLTRWRDCADALDTFDAAGVDYATPADAPWFEKIWGKGTPTGNGFVGNVWWATTGHLASMPASEVILSRTRWDAEFHFVGAGSPRVKVWNQSRVNLYTTYYPRSAYDPTASTAPPPAPAGSRPR